MRALPLLLALPISLALSVSSPLERRISPAPIRASCSKAVAFTGVSKDTVTNNYMRIKRQYTDGKRGIDKCPNGTSIATQEVRHFAGIEYLTDVTVNGQRFTVIFDTGSSDTWLVTSDYECVDLFGLPEPQSFCNFLSPGGFRGSFPKEDVLKDVLLDIRYGDQTFATGQFGYGNVTVAGLTVSRQQIALADKSYWHGNNEASGLMGFAYPALTAAYVNGTRTHYTPIFTSLYQRRLTAPSFSMALRRDGIGYLALGGLPPVRYGNNWASTPIVVTRIGSAFQYAYYSIIPGGLNYINSSVTRQSGIYLVDSGTTLSYFPASIAEAINQLFNPPAIRVDFAYYVECNAVAPDFSIVIDGVPFNWDPKDMVTRIGTRCMSGVQDATGFGMLGGDGQPVGMLGNSFLNSVVSVHDVGSAQMRFATHIY